MIIDRLRQDASFMRVLPRAGGWQKALLIDEVEVQKISATMLEAAERIEALEARATPASTFGTELSARIDSMLNKVFICANDEQQKTFNRMIVLLADCKAALTASATPALPQAEHDLQDVRCQCCGYMTYHSEHMGCIRAAYRQALPQGVEEWMDAHERQPDHFLDSVVTIRDLRAYLSGMAIVPVEPTEDMILAAIIAVTGRRMPFITDAEKVRAIWLAMLAAAKGQS